MELGTSHECPERMWRTHASRKIALRSGPSAGQTRYPRRSFRWLANARLAPRRGRIRVLPGARRRAARSATIPGPRGPLSGTPGRAAAVVAPLGPGAGRTSQAGHGRRPLARTDHLFPRLVRAELPSLFGKASGAVGDLEWVLARQDQFPARLRRGLCRGWQRRTPVVASTRRRA